MAEIRNLSLTIDRHPVTSQVHVNYELHFETSELQEQFVERVVLRGQDPLRDDNLAPLLLPDTVFTPGTAVVPRSINMSFPTRTLDEDRDLLWPIVIRNEDEIYARVSLAPLEEAGATVVRDSNVVKNQFGRGAP